MEWLAAVARINAVAGMLALLGVGIGAAWIHGPHAALGFGLTAGFLALWTFGCFWLGFVVLPNPEWKRDDRGDE